MFRSIPSTPLPFPAALPKDAIMLDNSRYAYVTKNEVKVCSFQESKAQAFPCDDDTRLTTLPGNQLVLASPQTIQVICLKTSNSFPHPVNIPQAYYTTAKTSSDHQYALIRLLIHGGRHEDSSTLCIIDANRNLSIYPTPHNISDFDIAGHQQLAIACEEQIMHGTVNPDTNELSTTTVHTCDVPINKLWVFDQYWVALCTEEIGSPALQIFKKEIIANECKIQPITKISALDSDFAPTILSNGMVIKKEGGFEYVTLDDEKPEFHQLPDVKADRGLSFNGYQFVALKKRDTGFEGTLWESPSAQEKHSIYLEERKMQLSTALSSWPAELIPIVASYLTSANYLAPNRYGFYSSPAPTAPERLIPPSLTRKPSRS